MTIRGQFRDAAMYLGLFVLAFPPLFIAADWLRYGA